MLEIYIVKPFIFNILSYLRSIIYIYIYSIMHDH